MKLVCLLLCCMACRAQTPGPSSAGHTVVLVAIEGFRWDYPRRYGAANLLAMAAHGASAPEGMLPAYPAQACPNLETLATGLYPEHHGIVANNYWDGARHRSCTDRFSAGPDLRDGVPNLWGLAESSACFGWVACRGASFVENANDGTDAARMEQTLAVLRQARPAKSRLITVALTGVDAAGRRFGPESPETRAAIRQADALVGRLRSALGALKLPADLIVVSDRGMAETEGRSIDLDTYTDLSGFQTAGALVYAPGEAEAEKVYEQLKIADARFKVYRRKDLPRELHSNVNPRAGDPVIVANGPVAIRAHAEEGEPPSAGSDGYDPRQVPEMKAIFYAEGPDIRAGVKLTLFENVNVYPFVAELLGLDAPKTDGSAGVLAPALAHSTSAPPR